MDRIDIENRLIDISVKVIELFRASQNLQDYFHLIKQVRRSSSSSALNYGEAQSAESRNDFIHKISIVLKELRETQINLKILKRSKIYTDRDKMDEVLKEVTEMVAIFQKSVNSAKKNNKKP